MSEYDDERTAREFFESLPPEAIEEIRTDAIYEAIAHGGHDELTILNGILDGEIPVKLLAKVAHVDEAADIIVSHPIAIILSSDLQARVAPAEGGTSLGSTPINVEEFLASPSGRQGPKAAEENRINVPVISSLN